MSTYEEFFLNSKASVIQLECIKISHNSFSQVYRIVRNHTQLITLNEDGTINSPYLTVREENGDLAIYNYYPLRLSLPETNDDLDQILNVQLGDLGEIIPKELDLITANNTFYEKPIVEYRTYRSDDLDNILLGPLVFEITSFAFTKEGCAFEAKAPSLNISKTGEIYSLDRFPMLRGFL